MLFRFLSNFRGERFFFAWSLHLSVCCFHMLFEFLSLYSSGLRASSNSHPTRGCKGTPVRVPFTLAFAGWMAMMHTAKPMDTTEENQKAYGDRRQISNQAKKKGVPGDRSERGSKPSFLGTDFGSYAASAVGGSRAPTRSGGRPEWYKRKTDLNSQIFGNLPYILGE